jgi:hypothetical protein
MMAARCMMNRCTRDGVRGPRGACASEKCARERDVRVWREDARRRDGRTSGAEWREDAWRRVMTADSH